MSRLESPPAPAPAPPAVASGNGASPNGRTRTTKIPGPRTPGWVQTAQFVARPDVFMERNWARYGDVFRARIHGWGTGRTVFVADPEMIAEMYRASPYALRLGEIAGIAVVPIAGEHSILSLDAPEHLEHRKIVNPPLHGERMRAYTGVMAEATDRSISQWPLGEPFALRSRFADITTEVIMSAIFGVERDDPRYEELSRRAIKLIDPENRLAAVALSQPRLRRDFGPVRYWSTFMSNRARVSALIYELITERRQLGDLEQREDILSIMLQSTFTDEEIHDELITLMLAGHETTATALSWTFDLLLHHPRVLNRLREELRAGDEEYLAAVVHEALRVRPVVATSQRIVREPIEIKGYTFEPGVTLLPAIWLVHRRADLYGPDPDVFRPERFLGVRPGTYEWIPFGGGIRRCIGSSLAPTEMRIVIKRVVEQTDLAPASPELERPQNKVVLLSPKNGTMAIRRA